MMLATSFPSPDRKASQVELHCFSVSSLFRRANNRNQIRISVRETTAADHFAAHRPTSFPFYTDRSSFAQSGNYTVYVIVIADVLSSVPSTNGLTLRVIGLSAEGKPVTLMDQNVYFYSGASGFLDDENGTYQTAILLCRPATPKRTSRRLSFRTLPVPSPTVQQLDDGAVVPLHIPQRQRPRRITGWIHQMTLWGY